jgi:hypothetical protein
VESAKGLKREWEREYGLSGNDLRSVVSVGSVGLPSYATYTVASTVQNT